MWRILNPGILETDSNEAGKKFYAVQIDFISI